MTTAVYKATDGSEHQTKALAKHREKLIEASAELQHAVEKVQRLLAESALTADGQQLEIGRTRDYWSWLVGKMAGCRAYGRCRSTRITCTSISIAKTAR